MAHWAVFDIDGTLLPKVSMERQFVNYLIKKRLLPLKNLFYYFLEGFTAIFADDWIEAIKGNKTYLKGLSTSTIDKNAEECFDQRIAPALFQGGKQKVEVLRQEGYKILIISASPVFLARRLYSVYYPDFIICTELEINNGYYTGKISGLYPYGRGKRVILENIKQKLDIDFDKSVVFANHHSDVFHMRLFSRAVAVNATLKLRRAALKYGWEIAVWG